MSLDMPISAQIQQFREKAVAGTLTTDEMREAVKLMRQGRVSAAARPKAASKKAAKGPVDADSLFGELDGI